MRGLLGAALLIAAAPVAALPPPVPVDVILFTPGEAESTAADARSLLDRLAAENWIGLGQVRAADESFAGCAPGEDREIDEDCIAAALASSAGGSNSVVLVAFHPGWQGRQHQLVCVGPEPARSKSAEVHLGEAAASDSAAAATGRRDTAGCLIGALHGPAAERG